MDNTQKTTIQIDEANRQRLRMVEADVTKANPQERASANTALEFLLDYYEKKQKRTQK